MTCHQCGETRIAELFYKGTAVRVCRICHRANVKRHQEAARLRDPEGYAERRRKSSRESQRKIRFGLTPERWAALQAAWGGRCGICQSPDDLVVDHDHDCCSGERTCGRCVRGLLCRRCNSGIGLLRDDAQLVDVAASYLRRHRRDTSVLEAVGRSLR